MSFTMQLVDKLKAVANKQRACHHYEIVNNELVDTGPAQEPHLHQGETVIDSWHTIAIHAPTAYFYLAIMALLIIAIGVLWGFTYIQSRKEHKDTTEQLRALEMAVLSVSTPFEQLSNKEDVNKPI